MDIRNYHWLNSASRVLISTCSAPLVQTDSVNNFHCLTSTYNPSLAKVKVNPHAKSQGQTIQTGECPQTHGRYQMYYRPCCAVDNEALEFVDTQQAVTGPPENVLITDVIFLYQTALLTEM